MSDSDLFGGVDRRSLLLALGGFIATATFAGSAAAAELYGPKPTGAKTGGTLNMGLLVSLQDSTRFIRRPMRASG